ncbi:MAG: hypothetical protein ACI9N1_002285 [Flavobacteriales bacterium]|jgi:hypothetical protein
MFLPVYQKLSDASEFVTIITFNSNIQCNRDIGWLINNYYLHLRATLVQ